MSILVAAVWVARWGDGVDDLVSVVDIGALSAFTLLHASVVGGSRCGGGVGWRGVAAQVAAPVLGAVIAVAVIGTASGAAQVVGAGWLVIGVGVLVGQRGRSAGVEWWAACSRGP
ncbi:hypothetical protein [Streptomyces sp. NPDC001978]|uniref:hypothetical protein n=1 Tax=Streptomyces sp. NPDC001978 TaxID=3364627 RepID=UPI0036B6DE80